MSLPYLIVGAGQAGSVAALAIRRAGFGGQIILIGDESEFPYERPPLSKSTITAEKEPTPNYVFRKDIYSDHSIELRLSDAVCAIDTVDRSVSLASGSVLKYEKLLLATGGRPRMLPLPGGDRAFYLRTFTDAQRIRAAFRKGGTAIIIGAGVIGLELAASAIAVGCEALVIELQSTVMGRLVGAPVNSWIEDLHRAAGVKFKFHAEISAIEGTTVVFRDGSTIIGDILVAGIGLERNDAIANKAGLATDNGILVDQFGQTSDRQVFAAGDVAAVRTKDSNDVMRLESWRHAIDHGEAVGRNMAGLEQAYQPIPWFWTDQHGVNIQVAGVFRASRDRPVVRGSAGSNTFSCWYLNDSDNVTCVVGFNAPRDVRAGMSAMSKGVSWSEQLICDVGQPIERLVRG